MSGAFLTRLTSVTTASLLHHAMFPAAKRLQFAIFSILTGLESGEKISQRCLIFPVMFFELLNFEF